jgi:hypothetical protein
MAGESILGGSEVIAFAPTTDPGKARAFYEGALGLRLVEDEQPFALVFDANGIMLRVTTVHELKPQPFTVLGWRVADIEGTVDKLVAGGVVRTLQRSERRRSTRNLERARRREDRVVQGSRWECIEFDGVQGISKVQIWQTQERPRTARPL